MRKIYFFISVFVVMFLLIVSLAVKSQNIVFNENFDGATHQMTSTGNPTWAFNSNLFVSGTKSIHNVIANLDSSSLVTPTLDLSLYTFVVLDFQHICKIEFFDSAEIYASIDNGATWQKLPASTYLGNGQYGTQGDRFNANSYGTVWLPASPLALPDNTWWRNEKFNVSSIVGNQSQVKFMFRLKDGISSPGANGNAGWFIDDIKVTAQQFLHDLTLKNILNPQEEMCYSGNQNVSIIIKNIGLNAVNTPFTASYKLGNMAVVNETVNIPIGVNDSITYSFNTPINFTLIGNDSTMMLRSYINISSDPFQNNDTLNKQIKFKKVPPSPLAVNATVPYGTTATLGATSTLPIKWFATPTSTNVLHEGSTYTTPILYGNTSYWASTTSNTGGNFMITEVSHFRGATAGAPSGGWPAYMIADDYIEITGTPNSDLAGFTLEQWTGTAMVGTHTFPAGTILSPNGTAILAVGQLGSSVPSPANFYYHANGTYTGLFSSGGAAGRILKAPNGAIIDAVASNSYVFPATSGVTAQDWSGNQPSCSSTAGTRLVGPYTKSSANWVVSSSTAPQNPNIANPGVVVPVTGCESPRVEVKAIVTGNPAVDAGVVSVNAPVSPTNLSQQTVNITIQNFGTSPLTTATINWSHNGVLKTPFSWTGNLALNLKDTFNIGVVNPVMGNNHIKAWTSNPNGQADPMALNDTVNYIFQAFEPLCGTYTIGGAGSNFATIADAVYALSFNGITCPVIFELNDDVYNQALVLANVNGMSATNTITFRPAAGKNVTITSASATATIKIEAASNFIIDGSNNGTSSRNLTITNTSTAANTAAIWIASMGANLGCENITIKNCNILAGSNSVTSTFGIYMAGNAISTSGTGASNNNITIENNSIQRAYNGIYARGIATTGLLTNLRILRNFIGSEDVNNYVLFRGVDIQNATAPLVEGNEIFNLKVSTAVNSAGIDLGANVIDAIINKNKIWGIHSISTSGYGAYGVNISATTTSNIRISNNVIYDLITSNYSASSTTWNAFGIRITGGTNHKVYYNSVNLFGNVVGGTSAGMSAPFIVTSNSATGLDVRNNVFVNSTNFATANSKSYAAYVVTGTTFANINRNDYFVSGTYGVLGFYGSDRTTLSAWQTASTQDANSISANPLYNTSIILAPQSGSPLIGAGIPITAVTHDFLDSLRSTTTPTIGAFENSGDYIPPVISYVNLENTTSLGTRTLVATITDASGIPTSGAGLPVLYWKINNQAYSSTQGVHVSGNTYEFTFGAGVNPYDVVSYYVVAQDLATTPNITAFPQAGAVGFSFNPPAVSVPPSTPSSYVVLGFASGVYTVGNNGNFPTLTAAVNFVNNSVLNGPVTLSLIDTVYTTPAETFPLVINKNQGSSSTNTLTIKPANNVNSRIHGSVNNDQIFRILNNYTIIDGNNSNTTTRNLTIENTSITTPQVIRIASVGLIPVTDVSVKNCNLINGVNTSSAVLVYGNDAAAGYFNRIELKNNSIQKAYMGIYSLAVVAPGNGSGLLIDGNNINTAGANAIRYVGVYVQGVDSAIVSNNIIGNFETTTGEIDRGIWFATGTKNSAIINNTVSNLACANTGAFAPTGINITTGIANSNINVLQNTISGLTTTGTISSIGISITGATEGVNIEKNKIFNIKNTNASGWGANGILLNSTSATANIRVVNNHIHDIAAQGKATGGANDNGYGIVISSGAGYQVYYNTVNLYTNQVLATGRPAAINITSGVTATNAIDLRNNTFTNFQTAGTNRYAIYCAAAPAVFADINYNNYFSTAPNVGFFGTNPVVDLTAWSTATGKDLNSISLDPLFVAPNSYITLSLPLNAVATPLVSVNDDIEGNLRDASTPDIGAFEFTPALIDAQLVAINNPTNSPCGLNSAELISFSVKNLRPAAITSINATYILDNGTPVTETFTTNILFDSTQVLTFITPANFAQNKNYNLRVIINLTGDTNPYNDTISNYIIRHGHDFVAPYYVGFETNHYFADWIVENPSNDAFKWELPFTGTANTGSFSARFLNGATNTPGDFLFTRCFNFIAGQTYNVEFFYRGSSTTVPSALQLRVGSQANSASMVDTLVNLPNILSTTYQKASVNFLAPTTGTYVFGFAALTAPNTTNMIIDDFKVTYVPDSEVSLIAINSPSTGCDLGLTQVRIQIKNTGAQSIVSGLTASYQLVGNPNIVTQIVDSIIPPNQTLTFNFATPIDLTSTIDTTYNFRAWVSLLNDPIQSNDTLNVAVVNSLSPNVPTVVGATVPYGGIATLTASSNASIFWYDTQTSTTLLQTGNSLTTPPLYQDRTYWVESNYASPNLKITEITAFRTGTGQTNPYPTWATGQDLVEISNLGTGPVDLNGYKFEILGIGARNYTFPSVNLLPGQVLILCVGAGTDLPANRYFNTGGGNDVIQSASATGFILRKPNDDIVDVVGVNSFVFLPSTGVTSAHWTGNIPSTSGLAGAIRTSIANNSASDWVVSSATVLQTIGAINPQLVNAGPVASTCPSQRVPVTATVILPSVEPELVSILTPVNNQCSNNSDSVKIRITNNGSLAIVDNFTASYTVNAGTPITQAITASIAPGDTLDFTFSVPIQLNLTTGDSTITILASVSHPQDIYTINNSKSKTVKIGFTPIAPTPIHASVSYGNTATLGVTSPGIVSWFNSPTSNTVIGTGTSFTTPILYGTTSYYASASELTTSNERLGMTNAVSTSSFITSAVGWGLFFSNNQSIIIDTVHVYPTGTGTINILILDSLTNNVLFTGPTVNITGDGTNSLANKKAVFVGLTIPAGSYKMSMQYTGITNLIREGSGATPPYVSPSGIARITAGSTGGAAPSTVTYYWFYDWVIKRNVVGCESPRTEVIATVTSNPPIDAGIVSIDAPTSPTNLQPQPINVTVKNFGTDPLTSLTIGWSVNGVVQTPFSWTGNIASNMGLSGVNIGTFTFPLGNSNLKVWSSMPNGIADPFPINDTVQTVINAFEPLCGTYTIGGPTSNFSNFADAVSSLVSYGITCPVIFEVADGIYNETIVIPNIVGTSSINTITFRPANGANVELTSASANATLRFNASSNIIFEGFSQSGNTRSFTITNTSTAANTAAIWVSSNGANFGSNNIKINNLIIRAGINSVTSTFGIYIAGTTISTSGTGAHNNNISIQGNIIERAYNGIYARGIASTGLLTGLEIKNNIIGSDDVNSYVLFRGVDIQSATAPLVESNEIFNLKVSTSVNNAGIDLGINVNNAIISKNKIYGIHSISTSGYGAYGINISATTTDNIIISNNVIYDIITSNYSLTSTTWNAFGIRITGGANHKVYYNSVNLFGNVVGGTSAGMSAPFIVTSNGATFLDVRNNVFANSTNFAVAGAKAYSAYIVSGTVFANINHNVYHSSGTSQLFGFYGADRADITAWRTASTQDLQSLDVNPLFNSNIILAPQYSSPILGAGTPIAAVTTDIVNNQRSASSPSIGAYEFGGDYAPPLIVYTPFTNTATIGARTLTAIITDASGVPTSGIGLPVLYWRINNLPYTTTQAIWTSGNNYEFTFGAGAASGDVVSYFIVAQDMNSTPIVGANPSSGASGFSFDPPAVAVYPVNPNSYMILGTISGTLTVGTGGDYPSLTGVGGLFEAVNNNVLTADVTVNILSNLTETGVVALNQFATDPMSSNYTLTIKPFDATVKTISGAFTGGLIRFNGADNVIIDGSFANAGQYLLFENTSGNANTAVFQFISLGNNAGASNNSIKNSIIRAGSNSITSTFGIYIGGTAINTTGTGAHNNNITISGNIIEKAYYGIYARGIASTGLLTGLEIKNNTIGSDVLANYVLFRGVDVQNATAPLIEGNNIFNLKVSTSVNNAAIDLGANVTNALVSKNRISGIHSTSTSGYGAYGINISATTTNNITIVNNMISDLQTVNYSLTSTVFNAFGIRIAGGSDHKVYYNSVNLFGPVTLSTSNAMSAALCITLNTVTGLDVRNNVFVNSQEFANAASRAYTVYAPTGTVFANINFNDYYSTGANAMLGFFGSDRATLTDWQTASSQDVNSISADPQFITPTDLHTNSYSINNAGTPIASVIDDFDGDLRHATTPDIGADEFTPSTTDAGVFAINSPTGIYSEGDVVSFSITVRNYGIDVINTIPIIYSHNSVVGNHTWTGTLNPGNNVIITLPSLTVAPGANNICAETDVVGDGILVNNKKCANFFGLPGLVLFQDDFEGSTSFTTSGTLWQHGVPAATLINTAASGTQAWVTNLTGNYPDMANATIVSPTFNFTGINDAYLSFSYFMDAEVNNDGGTIQYSTDNGINWAPLGVINDPDGFNWYDSFVQALPGWSHPTNGWKGAFMKLSVLNNAGGGVKFRVLFRSNATIEKEGMGFDNVKIHVPLLATDAGITEIVSPSGTSATGSPNQVTVKIRNNGTQTLTSIPVSFRPGTQPPVNGTWTGTLLPGDETTFTFTSTFIGPNNPFTLCAYTSLSGDVYKFNDTTCVALTPGLPTIDAGVTEIIAPTGLQINGQLVTVTVKVKNFGTQTLNTIPVQFAINGVTQSTEMITTPLAAGAETTYSFITKLTIPSSDFQLCAKTAVPSDAISTNDQTCVNIPVGIYDSEQNGLILMQNIPNPASESTVIGFSLPSSGKVYFRVTSVLGEVLYQESKNYDQGFNSIEIDTRNLAAGIYYYSITFDQTTLTRKMSKQ